jgi:transposase|tara:strand:- start:1103 stop:1438 length:336 start_codon:yes stop_codon:yes gene_type:complete
MAAVEPVDFRKGIDGLAGVCRNVIGEDPFSGYLFVFRNRRRTSIKILAYDGQGFWIAQKRLSTGRFGSWPGDNGQLIHELAAHELQLLVWNGNQASGRVPQMWKKISIQKS